MCCAKLCFGDVGQLLMHDDACYGGILSVVMAFFKSSSLQVIPVYK